MIHDRILLVRVERRGRVHQPVQIRLAVARLDRDRRWRLPARRKQHGDVRPLERDEHLAVSIADHGHRRNVRLPIGVKQIRTRRRQCHRVIAIFRREHRELLSVHPDPAEVAEVRIATRRLAHALKPQRPRLFIHPDELRHVARTTRDLALQLARCEIVQVELAPIVSLREPDHFVGRGQHTPVGRTNPRLVLRQHDLLEHVAHRAGMRVGHAEVRLLVIARRRHERHVRSIGIPLHIRPFTGRTRHVITQRGAMLVGGHLQSRHLGRIDVNDDTLNGGDDAVAGQRVRPRLQRWMARRGVRQVHHADTALVLLKRCDLLRIRRPHEHRAIAVNPAGVVGGVPKALDAILRERQLRVGGDVAHPEIVVLDEGRTLAIGRQDFGSRAAAARTARGVRLVHRHSAVTGLCATVVRRCRDANTNVAVGPDIDGRERQLICAVRSASGRGKPRRKLGSIKRSCSRALSRIGHDELRSRGHSVAIPEPIIRQPVWTDRCAKHQRRRCRCKKPLGLCIPRGRNRWLLCKHRVAGNAEDHRHRQGTARQERWHPKSGNEERTGREAAQNLMRRRRGAS